jgi:hypothetical protein
LIFGVTVLPVTRAVEDGHVSDRVIDEQILYYRRRAAGYDASAYPSLAVAGEGITRITSTLPAGVPTLELACGRGCGPGRWLAGRVT